MIMHFRVPMSILLSYIELVLSSDHLDLTDDLFMDFSITQVMHFLDINFSFCRKINFMSIYLRTRLSISIAWFERQHVQNLLFQ